MKPMPANHVKNLLAKIEDKTRREHQRDKLNAARQSRSISRSRR
jgi:hypothetical protein